ncbi:hypothetical protein FPV67DRAFT_1783321 [Lyophyllum atratum]|nr:hypothetical protein FPV67DRAFT_1783321 [Lyophyllum atratum]
MNRRRASPSYYAAPPSYVTPPSDTMLQPRPADSIPESRQLNEFLRSQAKLLPIPAEQLLETFTENYGSLQKAMALIHAADAHDAAAVAQASLSLTMYTVPLTQRKPIPGEDHDVQIAPLSDGVWVRRGQHMRTPSDIKVFSEATAWMPSSTQVLSIEASLDKLEQHSPQFDETLRIAREECDDKYQPDPEWETYIVQQGIRLCFKQAGEEDVFVDISRQTTMGATLIFQPWP